MRLFDIEPTALASTASNNRAAYAAEQELISRLLILGHHLAVPVVDDDGVDLVVDYRLKVQVKTTGHRNQSGALVVRLANRRASERNGRTDWIRPHIDIVSVKATDSGAWWHVPGDEWRARGSASISLYEHSARGLSCWHEAWQVFLEGGVPPGPQRTTATARPSSRKNPGARV